MTISVKELDPKFKYDIAAQPGGENIKACFACGVCTAGCPVSEIDERFDPRKIIRMILLGMKERVLSSDFIWLCAMCYVCSFHCPQDVKFAEVMAVLRDMAVREGYVHPSFPGQIKAIDNFSQDLRRQMVLAIVDKRSQEFSADLRELLRELLHQAEEKI